MSASMLGRPRSEAARRAVLEAVDDLLVEIGYAAMTMKGIAERAGVGRPTVYRWWSSKAEVLVEACVEDARAELTTTRRADTQADLAYFLGVLSRFLVASPAGLAYRALLGEAQHDVGVAQLVREADVLGGPARAVLERHELAPRGKKELALAVEQLTGPVVLHVLTTSSPLPPGLVRRHVQTLVAGWRNG